MTDEEQGIHLPVMSGDMRLGEFEERGKNSSEVLRGVCAITGVGLASGLGTVSDLKGGMQGKGKWGDFPMTDLEIVG